MASEYLQWKYRDVQPEEKKQYTKKERRQNWWHYHGLAVLLAVLLLIAGGDLLFHALGIGRVLPDYQVAYISARPLEEAAESRLQSALAALGEDCNGDGRILVQVNSYADMSASPEKDAAHYAAAAQVRLMADLESCESYFFLCQNPDSFQENYQILAREDGELARPGEAPLLLSALPLLADAAGSPEDGQALFLARRGFWEGRVCRHKDQCDALWQKLILP